MEESDNTEKKVEQTRLIAGVQYRVAGDIYTFMTDIEDLKRGDLVTVEGEHGSSVAQVIIPSHPVPEEEIPKNMKKVIRRATEEDEKEYIQGREEARQMFDLCAEKIREHSLPMKLIDSELVEGGKKVIFFFFAEQRIDFRALVKDLAGVLHRYIEMRQVGSRDAASFVGCMGPCGRMTCCSLYLREFQSISIAMAKNQGLSPNPAKLTGMCGKLKCCMAYENKAYSEMRKGLPKQGSWVETPKGKGKITNLDILKRSCAVRLEEGGEARFPCDECRAAERDRQSRQDAQKPVKKSKRPEKNKKDE